MLEPARAPDEALPAMVHARGRTQEVSCVFFVYFIAFSCGIRVSRAVPPSRGFRGIGVGLFYCRRTRGLKKPDVSWGCGIRGGRGTEEGGKECGRWRQCAALLAACRAASWRACLRRAWAGGARRDVLHASVRGRLLGVPGVAGSVHESVLCA